MGNTGLLYGVCAYACGHFGGGSWDRVGRAAGGGSILICFFSAYPSFKDKTMSRWVYLVRCFIMLPSWFTMFCELVKISVTAVKQQSSQTEREPKSDTFLYICIYITHRCGYVYTS